MRNFKGIKYTPTLADEMTAFFEGYSERTGAPSFEKFARAKGITLSRLQDFRKHKRFDAAYRECGEIRRDYLIDNALIKRFDPTFVRHLITDEAEAEASDSTAAFTLRVIEE